MLANPIPSVLLVTHLFYFLSLCYDHSSSVFEYNLFCPCAMTTQVLRLSTILPRVCPRWLLLSLSIMPSRFSHVGACQKNAPLCAQTTCSRPPICDCGWSLELPPFFFLAIMSAMDMSVCMSVQVPTCNYRAFFIVVETRSHSAALAILEYTIV